jgi:hypothetical protein
MQDAPGGKIANIEKGPKPLLNNKAEWVLSFHSLRFKNAALKQN